MGPTVRFAWCEKRKKYAVDDCPWNCDMKVGSVDIINPELNNCGGLTK